MKKRKPIFFNAFFAFILMLICGCQKEFLSSNNATDVDALYKKAQDFVKDRQLNHKSEGISFSDLKFDWKRRTTAKNKSGNKVLFVPISNRLKIAKEYWEMTFFIDQKGQEIVAFKQFLGNLNEPTLFLNVFAIDGSLITSGEYNSQSGLLSEHVMPKKQEFIIKKLGAKGRAATMARTLVHSIRQACPVNLFFNPTIGACDQRNNIYDDWASQYYFVYIYDDGTTELGPDSREIDEVEVPPPTNPNNPGNGGETPPGNGGGGVPVNPGGSGGNSGGNTATPPLNLIRSDCDAISLANNLNLDPRLQRIVDSIKTKTKEYGTYFSFPDPNNPNNISFGIIRTDAERSTINLPPKWNATDGFNFGTIHNHPAKSAPSPADIYNAVQDLAQMDNRNDVTDVQLTNYISKFASVVVSGDYIYTISIKNARYLSYAKEAFNPEKMKKLYDRHSKLYIDEKKFEGELTVEQRQQAGEYALLLLFGNEIHLTKQRIGGNNRAELIKRSGYDIQQVNPCL
ncbi:MAG: chitin binding peritrophin-A domain-containing protein [Sphingobacterium sp.]